MIKKLQLLLAATAAASLSLTAAAAPPQAPSLADQFIAGEACIAHRANPDLVWLETIGSVNGVRHEKLADELSVVLGDLQGMMEETDSTREDILELRVRTTSEAYQVQVAKLIAETPALAGIPFTYSIVDAFDVKWARVGLDAVLLNPKARGAIAARYGSNVGPDCQMRSS